MDAKSEERNPFITGYMNGVGYGKTSAVDRIEAVKTFSTKQCLDAKRNVPGLQDTVMKAINRRLAITSLGRD